MYNTMYTHTQTWYTHNNCSTCSLYSSRTRWLAALRARGWWGAGVGGSKGGGAGPTNCRVHAWVQGRPSDFQPDRGCEGPTSPLAYRNPSLSVPAWTPPPPPPLRPAPLRVRVGPTRGVGFYTETLKTLKPRNLTTRAWDPPTHGRTTTGCATRPPSDRPPDDGDSPCAGAAPAVQHMDQAGAVRASPGARPPV
jgi:hypothetical protein